MNPIGYKSHPPQFSGHFPKRLSDIYLYPGNWPPAGVIKDLAPEIEKIGRKEGFNTTIVTSQKIHPASTIWSTISSEIDNKVPWAQDYTLFVKPKQEKGYILHPAVDHTKYYDHHGKMREVLSKELNTTQQSIHNKLEGGNVFLGERADNTPFALAGKDVLEPSPSSTNTQDKKGVAEKLGVTPDHLHVIEQPDFHLDLALRPISNTHILQESESESIKLIDDAITLEKTERGKQNLKALKEETLYYYKLKKKDERYASSESTTNELNRLGFKVIPIPGLLGRVTNQYKSRNLPSFNFINAITHIREDGKLIYITNSSPYRDLTYKKQKSIIGKIKEGISHPKEIPLLDALFEKRLKEIFQQADSHLPPLGKVYFVKGGPTYPPTATNILRALEQEGGVHCLIVEKPASWIA